MRQLEQAPKNRRREARYKIEAGATVVIEKNGRSMRSTTVNMSESGVLLHFEEEPVHVRLGDDVNCDFAVLPEGDHPLPYCGLATVVRVDGNDVAIELSAGVLSPLDTRANNG